MDESLSHFIQTRLVILREEWYKKYPLTSFRFDVSYDLASHNFEIRIFIEAKLYGKDIAYNKFYTVGEFLNLFYTSCIIEDIAQAIENNI